MFKKVGLLNSIVTVGLVISFIGCASIPKEVVELSYRVGQDMGALQQSYDRTIHQLYEQLRTQRQIYLENSWIPLFIKTWTKKGKLVEVAKGELIWSDSADSFVASASGGSEFEKLATIQLWAEEAIFEIEEKRKELLHPLNREEDSLRTAVSRAFGQVIQANATITAHLNSLREVKEIQDEALKGLHLKEARDQIDNFLSTASARAAKALDKIREADGATKRALRKIGVKAEE